MKIWNRACGGETLQIAVNKCIKIQKTHDCKNRMTKKYVPDRVRVSVAPDPVFFSSRNTSVIARTHQSEYRSFRRRLCTRGENYCASYWEVGEETELFRTKYQKGVFAPKMGG